MIDKAGARDTVKNAIAALSGELRIVLDAQIATHITHLPFWRDARTVYGYLAMDDEVDLHAVFQSAIRGGKRIALPRTTDSGLTFHLVEGSASTITAGLERHAYGFLQPPANAPSASPDAHDIVLVPGRAFDRSGARVGRGGAYYDRFLSSIQPTVVTVGVGYSVQMFRDVPHDATDVSVQVVITDAETCFCRRPA
jgi:5-formyltetrahydrofolate cyclo-ligase